MKKFQAPGVETTVSRRCPTCGEKAALHGRFTRAIHDWEVTFVDCERLRCCGRTFTAAPAGLTPRSRYSDRVVALSRALAALNVSVRHCARLLREAGVIVTPQTVHAWRRGIRPQARAALKMAPAPEGTLSLKLRPDLWLSMNTRSPRRVESILSEAFAPAEEEVFA